ncbi:ClpP/crotonase [Phellopilus nigrolimitatus]|nr:ClpP/crotonase [Phellopilus nigrolimitatus]
MSEYHSSPFISVTSPSEYVLLVELQRLWTEFGQLFDKISGDGAVRAVVLASALPKLFTAGLDLNETTFIRGPPDDPARTALTLREHALAFQASISALERCRVPVIIAVHGLALGLGVDIACACDVRYAASDAVFCIKEIDIALAADIGTLARLPKIASNASLVRELALTARPFDAAEALTLGLVSRVVPGSRAAVVDAALETARAIAQKSPVAAVGTKRFLLHAQDHSVAENLEYTATWNAFALQAADVKDAIAAFQTKKPAKFKNLPKL